MQEANNIITTLLQYNVKYTLHNFMYCCVSGWKSAVFINLIGKNGKTIHTYKIFQRKF